jgi:hypothetical protein
VDILVVDVGEVDLELTGGGPQVALLENVQLMVLVDQNPDPDVKLPIVEQERPLDVFLDDEGVVLDLVAGVCRLLL